MNPRYRHRLPQLAGDLFLTDGGIETTLIFREGIDLPYFAAFDLLRHARGRFALDRYFRTHAAAACEQGVGFILESATWRASSDWATRLGYTTEALRRANREAIVMLHDLRDELEAPGTPMPVSGCIGPRSDGYRVDARMTPDQSAEYHALQVGVFASAGVDLITAVTMTYAGEAIGIVRAAVAAGTPAVVSFTTETDGRLPGGQRLGEAIEQVDQATDGAPAYYMVNCAHPTHFAAELDPAARWTGRLKGIRANASTKSHAELDACTELDAGDPADLAARYAALRRRFPHINVLGGCCGTDERHIRAIGGACGRVPPRS